MSNIVSINTEITEALRQYRINIDEAKMYLLGIYFNIDTQYISEKTRKQVNTLGIVEREYSEQITNNKIIWRIPLFNEEKSETFAWITDYMASFGRINKTRKGTKQACTSRMKKFFAENPEVRIEDVKAAVGAYHKTVTDPTYLKSAHKFIYEGSGFSRISLLRQYVDLTKEIGTKDGRSTKMK